MIRVPRAESAAILDLWDERVLARVLTAWREGSDCVRVSYREWRAVVHRFGVHHPHLGGVHLAIGAIHG